MYLNDYNVTFILDITATKRTWFFNNKILLEKKLLLTMAFSNHMDYEQAVTKISVGEETTSEATVADSYSYCQIGGPGRVEEVDKTKIGKRKYNRGR